MVGIGTQQVLANALNWSPEMACSSLGLWRDSRSFTIYACLLSAFALGLTVAGRSFTSARKVAETVSTNGDSSAQLSITGRIRQAVHTRGGTTVFTYDLIRLICTGALFILSILSVVFHNGSSTEGWSLTCPARAELIATFASGYATLLCTFGAILHSRGRIVCNAHAAFTLLVLFGVFAYRNIYPLMYLDGRPSDDDIPWMMYARGTLVTLSGLVIPVLIPRTYVPVDPEHPALQPNPEQTASILSFLTFTFTEPIIMAAYRNSNLPYESLPPLADYDWSSHLEKRSIDAMDPIVRRGKGLKDRNLFFGIMQVFFWEYLFFGFDLLIDVLSRFMTPFALNRLLSYLQYGNQGSTIRPWQVYWLPYFSVFDSLSRVWIATLLVGGTLASLFRNLYIFVGEHVQVQAENILLQQIFRHALRLRVSEESSTSTSETQSSAASVIATTTNTEDSPAITLVGTESSTANISETVASGSVEPFDGPAEKAAPPLTLHLAGRINTLMGADIGNILGARDFLVLLVMLPFQVIISMWFLYNILGWSAIVGMGSMVAMMPIPGMLAKRINEVQGVKMQRTEARVQAITESMNIIRMIKMFGWERMTIQKLGDLRTSELTSVRTIKFLELFGAVLNNVLPVLILIVTFTFHTVIMRKELDAASIFSTIVVLDLIRLDLGSVPYFITTIMQARVSFNRMTNFLNESPMLDQFSRDVASTYDPIQRPTDDTVIGMKNVKISWSESRSESTTDRRIFSLKIDELVFDHGALTLITGPTGCGKTSLILGLLGEMHVQNTSSNSWVAFPTIHGVAYAAQESWVQSTTIQENITFLEPYDEQRYKKVMYQCALEKDLALLSAGDQTEVGEKGLTLSGGQKARITLARAIYSSAQTIILDDVLSALDVHTSRWIVNRCLQGDLTAGRTIIIATHAVDLVSPLASRIIQISRRGDVSSFAKTPEVHTLETTDDSSSPVTSQAAVTAQKNGDPAVSETAGKLTVDEELESGRLRWTAIELLINAFGGYPVWAVILGTSLIVYVSSVIGTWWLGVWASAFEESSGGPVYIPFYLGVFSAIAVLNSVLYALAYIVFLYASMRASSALHEALSRKILGSTLRWLDVTPVGRIISRFTQDISTIDGPLTEYLQMFISFTLSMLIQFGAVIVFAPIFIIPGIIIAVTGITLGQIFIAARLPVRRLVSNWRSPLYTHFSAAVEGMTSIRAFGAQAPFQQELYKRLDAYTRPSRAFHNLDRWVAVRTDVLGALFSTGLAIYLVYMRPALGASNTGFALNMSIGFSGLLLFWVRLLSEVETCGNSLERIRDYLLISQEPIGSETGKPPAYWPASGALSVKNLEARYSSDGPAVLKRISFEVKSAERVGIVGRTGSGKSSLALSLLKLIPTSGDVYFDGIPTENVNLDILRSKMAIIPQDPTLISGTIRSNLDPIEQHDDAVLHRALRAVGLIGHSESGETAGFNLDTVVSSSGSNFSVGQRQLIALARAMVRGTRVLILDEATASVDAETDHLIQTSIRTELKGTTLLTIAHRLQTIMDYDKIMVLDSGELVEFGNPLTLLEKENGVFRALVDGSPDHAQLWRVVKNAAK
ncbi:multidrug resistance-associated ABC transporter [Calocera cornea HHB12733]|uniref:Multidrug resistance-associated ABC transporter n=1 Tax=Calocera cornea HHB12733 TaxID=1353952 RepID=A0A165IIE3_9BASI|nr:multidrug resistance-associated ABC transporter [Calocera cornea HHB12733]